MVFLKCIRPILYPNSTGLKVSIIVIGCFIQFFCPGIFYSWPTLLITLEEQGVYSELCENITETEDCIDRDIKFNFIFTIAMVGNLLSAISFAYIVELIGSQLSLMMSGAGFGIGSILFAYSNGVTFDAFAVGSGMMIFFGTGCFYSTLPLIQKFGKLRDITITAWNFVWDAGAVVFLIFYFLWKGISLSYQEFFVYLSIPGFLVFFLSFLFPISPEEDDSVEVDTKSKNEENKLIGEEEEKEVDISLISIIFSKMFIIMSIYYALIALWYTFYIGALNDELLFLNLKQETHDQAVIVFNIIFALLFLAGVPSVLMVDKLSITKNFIIVHISLFTFAILKLIPILWVQYINFVFFIVGRSHFYVVAWVWIAREYPKKYYGKLIGVLQLFSGSFIMMQYPMYYILKTYLDNKFGILDIIQASCFTLSIGFIIVVAFREKNKRETI